MRVPVGMCSAVDGSAASSSMFFLRGASTRQEKTKDRVRIERRDGGFMRLF